ncbi:hypothetical protein [Ramlibacter montanisoli]|uniref:hypothetical protein n=1 Tax=Ramlibacter montanisoli TaxID=2732512 RepID=UPI0035A114D8
MQEARAAVPAQVRHDHPAPARGEDVGRVDVAVEVVGIAVHQQHRDALARAGLEVADVQFARADLPDLRRRTRGRACLRPGGAGAGQRQRPRDGGDRGAREEGAAARVAVFHVHVLG